MSHDFMFCCFSRALVHLQREVGRMFGTELCVAPSVLRAQVLRGSIQQQHKYILFCLFSVLFLVWVSSDSCPGVDACSWSILVGAFQAACVLGDTVRIVSWGI